MRIYAIASDYDGTLATAGRVPMETLRALERFRAAGHRLILVTGRELEDLKSLFPEYGVLDLIVAENGAVLYDTATREERLLAVGPPADFLNDLRRRIGWIYAGKVLVAAAVEHSAAMQAAIDEAGLEFQLILNKDAVMMLPGSVNKASGLAAALLRLRMEAADTVGVGDAENDEDLLRACGYGVAVANALPKLKAMASWVTPSEAGAGVAELVSELLSGSRFHN